MSRLNGRVKPTVDPSTDKRSAGCWRLRSISKSRLVCYPVLHKALAPSLKVLVRERDKSDENRRAVGMLNTMPDARREDTSYHGLSRRPRKASCRYSENENKAMARTNRKIFVYTYGMCYGYIVYGYKELHPLGLALFP